MKGYKGFNQGLVCKNKQYAENTIFKENNAEIYKSAYQIRKFQHYFL